MSNVHGLWDADKTPSESKPLDQQLKLRNTISGPGKRTQNQRAWMFTLNNYTKKEIDTLTQRKFTFMKKDVEISKYLFQEEIGDINGVPHLQGCVYFKNKVGLKCLKVLLYRAHWEPCDLWPKAMNYCSKKFTQNGETYRYGCRENRKKKPKKTAMELYDSWRQAVNEHMKDNVYWQHQIYLDKKNGGEYIDQ